MTETGLKTHLEVRVTVSPSQVDAVTDFIIDNLANGLVLEEEEGQSSTTIVFYIAEKASDELQKLSDFIEQLPGETDDDPIRINHKLVRDISWLDEYRKSIQPIRIKDKIEVRPPWIESSGLTYDIVIEPKMAFGTGSHETTQGCLKAVLDSLTEGVRFLDVGCGSGILSILADKMGASYIKGVDYDIEAIINCRENFELNGVRAPYDILHGTIEVCENDEPYQFVVANIIRSTILEILDRLLDLTTKNGKLILSGLLLDDESAISSALREKGQTDFVVSRDKEWLTFMVNRV